MTWYWYLSPAATQSCTAKASRVSNRVFVSRTCVEVWEGVLRQQMAKVAGKERVRGARGRVTSLHKTPTKGSHTETHTHHEASHGGVGGDHVPRDERVDLAAVRQAGDGQYLHAVVL